MKPAIEIRYITPHGPFFPFGLSRRGLTPPGELKSWTKPRGGFMADCRTFSGNPPHPVRKKRQQNPFLFLFLLAFVFTLADAWKPLHVDDTAYAYYARQIARDPWDPYGFEVFWYQAPVPANQ